MAKIAAEMTQKQKTLSDAKIKLDKAQEAFDKSNNAATKAALDTAQKTHDDANNAVRRENYIRVGGNRVTKAAVAVRNIGNVSNRRTYAYSEADVTKWFDHLQRLLNDAKAKQLAGLQQNAPTAQKEEFSF